MHRKYSGRKHTQKANGGEHLQFTASQQTLYAPALYFPNSSSDGRDDL